MAFVQKPGGCMADDPSPLRLFAQAAHAACELRLDTEFALRDGGRLTVCLIGSRTPCPLCRRSPGLTLKLATPDRGWERSYQDHEVLADGTPRVRDLIESRRKAGADCLDFLLADQDESSAEVLPRLEDVADALRRVATEFPGAVPREDSVAVTVRGGPMGPTKLAAVAVRAWAEVFGAPVPSVDELAARRKARRVARHSAGESLVALLKGGPEGVAAFNAMPAEERAAADLRKADLASRRLDGVVFSGANLSGADLSRASLTRARFAGAPESGRNQAPARLESVKAVGADLTGASLSDAQAAGADFSGATLRGAYLGLGDFRRARFVGADLTDARFFLCDLRGADFTDATLKGTDFGGAKFDEHTRWPRRFRLRVGLDWRGSGPDPRGPARSP
jgi:hypothetical protein